MLLQAGCIICLGNILLKSRAPSDFIVKAFYIDNHYKAIKYTVFQWRVTEGHHQDPIEVIFPAYFQVTRCWELIGGQKYIKTSSFNLDDRVTSFKFMFWLNNLFDWCSSVVEITNQFSNDQPAWLQCCIVSHGGPTMKTNLVSQDASTSWLSVMVICMDYFSFPFDPLLFHHILEPSTMTHNCSTWHMIWTVQPWCRTL